MISELYRKGSIGVRLFSSLGLDKAEWLEDIQNGSCSLKSFLGVAGEGIDERESSKASIVKLNFRCMVK